MAHSADREAARAPEARLIADIYLVWTSATTGPAGATVAMWQVAASPASRSQTSSRSARPRSTPCSAARSSAPRRSADAASGASAARTSRPTSAYLEETSCWVDGTTVHRGRGSRPTDVRALVGSPEAAGMTRSDLSVRMVSCSQRASQSEQHRVPDSVDRGVRERHACEVAAAAPSEGQRYPDKAVDGKKHHNQEGKGHTNGDG